MTRPTDEQVLAFLHGELSKEEHESVLAWIETSPDFASEVRTASAGLEALRSWAEEQRAVAGPTGADFLTAPTRATTSPVGAGATVLGRRVPAWWLPLSVAATLSLAIPVALTWSTPTRPPTAEGVRPGTFVGAPEQPDPSFVVVLHGRWPDAAEVPQSEATRRAAEYWAWASDLADRGLLVAAGDLRWEPGLRLASTRSAVEPPIDLVADPDFLVGMFTVRASTYEEARAIAEGCPHLDYGGSVSVRQVGGGFVTVPGMDDWSD